jgi:hypothetical protein
MNRKERLKQLAHDLISKQLEIAGVGRTLEEFTQDDSPYKDLEYYSNYEITFEQHQQWLDYAVPLVQKVMRCKKAWAMREVQMLDLNFGLSFAKQDRDKFFSKN